MASRSQIKRLQTQGGTLLFADQAANFLSQSVNRKRNPIRPATARTYAHLIRNHVNPAVGRIPLEAVGNAIVKDLVTHLVDKGLSAATIQVILGVIKQIRGSAINSEGEQLFPYTWNSEFIDAPVLDVTKQERPTITAEGVTGALKALPRLDSALIALLAGSGLRISEALAIKVGQDDQKGTFWLPSESKIIVREQRIGLEFAPAKTRAGIREVDLDPKLNNWLMDIFEDRFLQVGGKPGDQLLFKFSESFYRNTLDKTEIEGYHALRRFRETWLEQNNCPRMLMKFWTGHAASDITERYIKVGAEIDLRKREAERIGLGFKLPEETCHRNSK